MSDEARAVPVEGDRERLADFIRRAEACDSMPSLAAYQALVTDLIEWAGVSLTGSGLDVERLARAQVRSGIDTFLPGEDRWISANEAQAAIAREYATLSGESGEPTR